MIGGVSCSAEGVVIEFFGAGIHIKENLLVPTVARAACPKRMLGAIFKAAVVGPWAIRDRHGFFSRRDAPDHFLQKFFAERLHTGQHALGVGVFSLEVLGNIRAQNGRITQNLLPVLILHPGIGIGAGPAKLRG